MITRSSKLLWLLVSILIYSCSNTDEDLKTDEFLEVSDFNKTVEAPLQNGDVIGKISVNTSESDLIYRIQSQDPDGAISIDENTGILAVSDITKFDFENEAIITGKIEVISGELRSELIFKITLSSFSTYELEVIDYFKEIALGFEFGSASQITRRWENDMRIFVGGSPSASLSSELDKIIEEINDLTTSFSVRTVSDSSQSNYYIFFGSASDFGNIFPDQSGLAQSNWGLFFLFWNSANQLNSGYMYVDIFRASSLEQRHLLREELTQSLGLARDSDQYSESIFQQSFNTKTTQYAEIDEDLIWLLYHPDMSVGLNSVEVDKVLRSIISKEW